MASAKTLRRAGTTRSSAGWRRPGGQRQRAVGVVRRLARDHPPRPQGAGRARRVGRRAWRRRRGARRTNRRSTSGRRRTPPARRRSAGSPPAWSQDGMVVLLDSGTTTLAMARALHGAARADDLHRQPRDRADAMPGAGHARPLLGGEVDPNDEATTGIDMIEAVGRFRVDIAFVGVGGLVAGRRGDRLHRVGAEQRGRMIAAATQAYFVRGSQQVRPADARPHPEFRTARRPDRGCAAAAPSAVARWTARGLRVLVAPGCLTLWLYVAFCGAVPLAWPPPGHGTRARNGQTSFPTQARAVIIGGGIVGCSLAYHLTRARLARRACCWSRGGCRAARPGTRPDWSANCAAIPT